MRPARSLFVVILLAAAASVGAADWPRFLGPGGLGISPETGLARAWPEGGPKVVWAVDVGLGYGGAAVRDGEVFLMDRVSGKQDVLRCLDLATGREKWHFAYDAPGRVEWPGSRTVPTVTEKFVYTLGGLGHVHCVDRATHRPAWSRQLEEDFISHRLPEHYGDRRPNWGHTRNPVLYGDAVIVSPHQWEAGLVALDKTTGAVLWRSSDVGFSHFSHATPLVTTLCGTDQIVTVANYDWGHHAPSLVSGVDARTGRVLWQIMTWRRYNMPIPSPVRTADDRLFVAGGYTIGCFGLKLSPPADPGDAWRAEIVFKDNTNCTPHLHTPIFHQGHLYAQSYDKFHNKVNLGLVCVTPDGELKWASGRAEDADDAPTETAAAPSRRRVTFENGNLLIADGLIFVMHGRTGELNLVEATPEAFRLVAKAKVLEARGGKVWAPMALAEGMLIVRDLQTVKCLDVRAP